MKRYPYANVYEKKGGLFQAVLGGIPNVTVDVAGNLQPMDNRIIGSPGNTIYKVARGQGKTFIQDRTTNKYLTRLETLTGESLEITLPNLPAATPVILPDGVSIEWVFPQGHKVTQYVTEKHLKEIVFQKKNVPILFQYKPTGLDVIQKQYILEFYSQKTGKLVYKTERPYYEENDEIKYVDLQIQKANSNWHITYLSHSKNREIDPTVYFGDGSVPAGQLGAGNHKACWIRGDVTPDASSASSADMRLRGTGVAYRRAILMRFSLVAIPANAIINTSVLSVRSLVAPPLANNTEARRLITNWGVTLIDEGITENPATGGQATWNEAFDYNGVGDIPWAGGANFVEGNDCDVVEDTQNVIANNTWYHWSIPVMTRLWIGNDATNYGLSLGFIENAGDGNFDSNNAVNTANRPYLTVTYTLPSVRRTLQSKISIPVGIGIH